MQGRTNINENINWVTSNPDIFLKQLIKSNKQLRNKNCLPRKKTKQRRNKFDKKSKNRAKLSENVKPLPTYIQPPLSPVLKSTNTIQKSPVLTKKRKCTESGNELNESPILNRNKTKLLKLCRTKISELYYINETNEIEIVKSQNKPIIEEPYSPDKCSEDENYVIDNVSSQQSSCDNNLIIEDSLETRPQLLTVIETTQASKKSSNNENYVIDNNSSQPNSIVTISSAYTIIPDSLEKSSEDQELYSPKKKKKYKIGTLSYRFEKILRKQRADVAIWKHELYLASTSNYSIPSASDDKLITVLKVNKVSNNFGTNILECTDCNNTNEKCLIIADFSYYEDLRLSIDDSIKIFPPFFVKYFHLNNDIVKTFINVHKIIKLN